MFRDKLRSGYCHCKPATHAFCEKCQRVREIEPRPIARTSALVKFEGCRVLCGACGHEISRMYRERLEGARDYLTLVRGRSVPAMEGEE